jgi:hypothetical protein
MKGRILGVCILLLCGIARFPLESAMTRQRQSSHFNGFTQNAHLRQQVGQSGMVAILGGMRSSVADLLWIRAHMAWSNVEWGRMKYLFDGVTTLQPRSVMFWDISSWHMAYNASVYCAEDQTQPPDVRVVNQQQYFRVGEDYLLRGIEANPDSWELYSSLGTLYRDKLHDPCKAAAAFAEAAKRPDHLAYVERFAAYMLADCPDHQQEAYEQLLAFYNLGEQEWLPTLLKKLQVLERKLAIPPERRVPIPPKFRLPPE